jgi:hypothetical protein
MIEVCTYSLITFNRDTLLIGSSFETGFAMKCLSCGSGYTSNLNLILHLTFRVDCKQVVNDNDDDGVTCSSK